MNARAFRVTGRVQGVGFRWSAQEEARRLGLAGWIGNEDDGAVSGVAQGPPESLEAFHRWLSVGPRSARVEAVAWDVAEPSGLRLFVVR
jgi:acylphosphatase